MSTNYNNKLQKRIILFSAGAGGHFLSQFLIPEKPTALPTFRIDINQRMSKAYKFVSASTGTRLQDFASQLCLDAIIDVIKSNSHTGVLSHYLKISNLREYTDIAWIRKIHPTTNIFGWIKNINFKKRQMEFVDYSSTEFKFQFDSAFAMLIDWYDLLKADDDLPPDLLINFGDLYNIEYLKNLYYTLNGYAPNDSQIAWAEEYINNQFAPINDSTSKDLDTIIKEIMPTDFFDVATALFIYEKNHNTVDRNRLWTINHLPNNVNDAINFLLSNSKNYTIFKGN
jgi:hypothetical protein